MTIFLDLLDNFSKIELLYIYLWAGAIMTYFFIAIFHIQYKENDELQKELKKFKHWYYRLKNKYERNWNNKSRNWK